MEETQKPQCEKCNGKAVYTLKDGTIVCKTCGSRKEVQENG